MMSVVSVVSIGIIFFHSLNFEIESLCPAVRKGRSSCYGGRWRRLFFLLRFAGSVLLGSLGTVWSLLG